MTAKISSDLHEEIVSLYVSGLSAPEICKRLGVSKSAIYRGLHRAGIHPNQYPKMPVRRTFLDGFHKLSDEQLADAVEKYQAGFSLSQLARLYATSTRTVGKSLRNMGVELRRRGGADRQFTEDQVSDMARRWMAGESQTKIAEAYNSKQTTISRVLRKHGIETDTRHAKGDRHGNWNGGKHVSKYGYTLIRVSNDSPYFSMCNNAGYAMEHRLVMAQHLGRPLDKIETVHHINGNRSDNRIENLQLRVGNHGKGKVPRCRCCGSYDIEFTEMA